MENFVYDTPTMVYFGKGEEEKVGKLVKAFNPKKVLIHYGCGSAVKSGLIDKVKKLLDAEGLSYVELGGVVANPELPLVRKGIELCKNEGVDFVLAVGGGSVLDSAKDIANGVANPDVDVWDFSLGKAQPATTLHKGCILTLSAAGSEMSNSCVISNPETGDKRGYGSHFNRMDFAIENPELTYSVNAYQTACGAVDIAMHTIERYFMPDSSGGETYLTDEIAEAVIKNAHKAGLDAIKNPNDYDARANMMWASSLAHNGLTGCGRTFQLTVHQLEHELSGVYPRIAHGAGLAALWCSWARYVYKDAVPRFLKYAKNVWGVEVCDGTSNPSNAAGVESAVINPNRQFGGANEVSNPNGQFGSAAEDAILKAIQMQENYYKSIGMPTTLRELDVKKEDLELLAEKCSRGKTRTIAGYKPLAYEDVLKIYEMAY